MARSRFASIWPPGAIRLVPTLMTTLIRSRLSRLAGMVSHLTTEEDFPFSSIDSDPKSRGHEAQGARRGGQYDYPAIRMGFWQDEKSCHFQVPCLLLTLPAASPIGSKTTCVTARDILPRLCES